MKPSEVYKKLLDFCPDSEVSICDLRTVFCLNTKDCDRRSFYKSLDFDAIKDYYCSLNKKESMSSVDAIAIDIVDMNFYFVEKKSSKLFLKYGLKNVKSDQIENKMEEQLNGYDLTKKYRDSCVICSDIVGNVNLFNNLSHSFVYLSDIILEKEPVLEFYSKLDNLAQTSSSSSFSVTEDVFLHKTIEKVNSLSCDSIYLYCRDFDIFLRGEIRG